VNVLGVRAAVLGGGGFGAATLKLQASAIARTVGSMQTTMPPAVGDAVTSG
jgi:hypothetical protein